MNRLRTLPGIVLVEIKDQYLLVADKEARKCCRYILPINETIAFYWHLLEQGCTEEQLLEAAKEEFDAPSELLISDLHLLLDMFRKLGYLIS